VRDADFLARWRWRFLVADEAQRVKNPGTQRASAIRKIPAEARIAITGTPVENRLRDLWSIFDFLASGYLGNATAFDRQYADPIERRGDKQAVEQLMRRTKPFLLRRLKRQVAAELPEKILNPLRCELTTLQRELYQAVLTRDLQAAIRAVQGRTLSLGNPHIFAVLTKLKQICCHPGLVTGDFQPYRSGMSGKFDTFIEVFDEITEDDRSDDTPNKLVTFSQYVPMATYLRGFLDSRGKTVDLIDGSVPPSERLALCKRYNANPSRFGMVLTLGSGGVGLDLQTANHVVMYDRWWNPAVEDQAIDRVHRLGQARNVVITTITTRGTLEERIQVKLETKRSLSDQVIQADELMRKDITRDELLDLVRLDP
jgi:SNF2 family DNA or RNA helicase